MPPTKGPIFDRVLMRVKDFIIIGTAVIALVKWFYVNPTIVDERLSRQEKILEDICQRIEKIERAITRAP